MRRLAIFGYNAWCRPCETRSRLSFLRTMSTARLSIALGAMAAIAAVAAAIAVAASSGNGSPPPPKPLAQAIHDSLAGGRVDGITGRITFTNNLLPSGALTGSVGSPLLSGATGRLWATDDGRGRLELQSDAGDTQIVWNHARVTIYDASSNTTYRLELPTDTSSKDSSGAIPTLTQISRFLTKAADHVTISGANPTNTGGQPAYSVSVSPKLNGGLLGSLEIAWDAAHAVPLRIAVTAKGSSAPVLALTATDVSYGPVASSDVDVSPPAGAKVVDLSLPTSKPGAGSSPRVTGLTAVQQKLGFSIVAPDTLAGRARNDVRLAGGDTALLVYGRGLDAIVVDERAADAGSGGGPLGGLPTTVSLDGVTAHEIATPLGTALEWQRSGVAFMLAGSVSQGIAESAARELR